MMKFTSELDAEMMIKVYSKLGIVRIWMLIVGNDSCICRSLTLPTDSSKQL